MPFTPYQPSDHGVFVSQQGHFVPYVDPNNPQDVMAAHQAMRQQMSQAQGTPLQENDTRGDNIKGTSFVSNIGTGVKQTGKAITHGYVNPQVLNPINTVQSAAEPALKGLASGARSFQATPQVFGAVKNAVQGKPYGQQIQQASQTMAKPVLGQKTLAGDTVGGNLLSAANAASNLIGVKLGGSQKFSSMAENGLNAVKSDSSKIAATGQKGLDYLKTKGDAMAEAKNIRGVTDLVQPQMNKKLAINTLKQTGTKFGGAEEKGMFGTIAPKATPKIESVAADVQGLISKNKSPIKNLTSLSNEIGRMSEQELRPGLQANKTLVRNTRAMQRIDQLEPTRLIKSDATLNNTYKQVKDLMAEKIAQHSKDSKSIDSESLWNARKQFDHEVEQQFGEAVYNPEKNSAVKAAIRDVRSQMNDMIGEINPQYRAQLKKLNSMYTARDTIAENNYKLLTGTAGKYAAFKAEHPIATKIAKYGAEALGAGAVLEGTKKILGR